MDGFEKSLSKAVEVEEELTNVLAKALESIVLSIKTDISEENKKRIIEILNIIQKDTGQHKAEILNLLKKTNG